MTTTDAARERKLLRNRERMRRLRAADPEMHRALARESMRRFRETKPEQNRATKRRHYALNREADVARSVQWAKDNPEKARARVKRWREANPEKHAAAARQYSQKRRALKREAAGDHTAADVEARFAFHGHRCVYCGTTENLTADHMIPLARGGSNWPANLVPACDPCNKSKHTQTYFEFIASRLLVAA